MLLQREFLQSWVKSLANVKIICDGQASCHLCYNFLISTEQMRCVAVEDLGFLKAPLTELCNVINYRIENE